MTDARGQRIELTWANKDKILLLDEETKKPKWTSEPIETRPLIEVEQYGTERHKPRTTDSNLLIKGDNLYALKALEAEYAGEVKCIYIDPPFNTGQAFEHYDDCLEHSIWLTMMRDRLEIMKKLLDKDNGVIFVHIDQQEIAYLTILMNEIFGRHNYLNIITVRVKVDEHQRTDYPYFFNVNEYILVYAKNKERAFLDTTYVTSDIDKIQKKISKYNKKIILKVDIAEKTPIFCERNYTVYEFKEGEYKVVAPVIEDYRNNPLYCFQEYKLSPKKEETGGGRAVLLVRGYKHFNPSSLYFLSGARSQDGLSGKFVTGEAFFQSLGSEFTLDDITLRYSDNWTMLYSKANTEGAKDERGNIIRFDSKKPEDLIQRIIHSATKPCDLILDCFAGSGTTGAVAHKMGRRWIMVEMGEQVETHCLKRLKGIVDGTDQTGISKDVNWQGGGGFRYLTVGESLIKRDEELDTYILNPKYKNGLLVQAVCAHQGYRLTGNKVLHGINGINYAHVTEEYVTQLYLDNVVRRLSRDNNLTIYAPKFSSRLRQSDNVKVKKIIKALLEKYGRK